MVNRREIVAIKPPVGESPVLSATRRQERRLTLLPICWRHTSAFPSTLRPQARVSRRAFTIGERTVLGVVEPSSDVLREPSRLLTPFNVSCCRTFMSLERALAATRQVVAVDDVLLVFEDEEELEVVGAEVIVDELEVIEDTVEVMDVDKEEDVDIMVLEVLEELWVLETEDEVMVLEVVL